MKFITYLLALVSLTAAGQCPTWDSTTDYFEYQCAHYNGVNYLSKKGSNIDNNPVTETRWWGACNGIGDHICGIQYVDTIIVDSITVYDTSYVYQTIYDTLEVYDTVQVFDTIVILDTIIVFDTTFVDIFDTIDVTVYDTLIHIDTITHYRDTIPYYLDTVTIHDTIQHIDSICIETIYDTVTIELIVFDTVTVFDTVGVNDSILTVIRDSLISESEYPILDSFSIVGLTNKSIQYIFDSQFKEPPILEVNYEQSGVSKDVNVTLQINVLIFDHLGQFVDDIRLSRDVNRSSDPDDKLLIKEQFIVGRVENGRLVDASGRAYGTGVYILKGIVRIIIDNKVTSMSADDMKYGYKRTN